MTLALKRTRVSYIKTAMGSIVSFGKPYSYDRRKRTTL